MTERESLTQLAQELEQLASENRVDKIIEALRSATTPQGPIHPNNEAELSVWNIPAYFHFLRVGKYQDAEAIYRAFYERLEEEQKELGRLHKGMALQNLGLSIFFQGRTTEAIKCFLCAFIEDVISSGGASTAFQAPACQVLQGICGVPSDKFQDIRHVVLEAMKNAIPLDPETIYSSQEAKAIVIEIQNNYKLIPNTWKWEIDGRRAIENSLFEKSYAIYYGWYKQLLVFQKKMKKRIHKGHPLFNAGLSCFLFGGKDKAFRLFLWAYVEDVITASGPGEADQYPAFRNLSSGMGNPEYLRRVEAAVFRMKSTGEELADPANVLIRIEIPEGEARRRYDEESRRIAAARQQQEEELDESISRFKEIDDETDNTLYILKRWNSTSPRYPHRNLTGDPWESVGGGYFLVWQKKGIVIDPGYDFLKLFQNEGFGVRNIDLIIVTHAHDDHNQDLEPIFSLVHKLSRRCKISHNIDLVASEAVQIKFSRLLTIMQPHVTTTVLRANDVLDSVSELGRKYNMEITSTPTFHNEQPWMLNNTGFGITVSLTREKRALFKIGITGDTSLFDGIETRFNGVDLLIEHLGTDQGSEGHLCMNGCVELLRRIVLKPKMVVVSEFGEELRGHRVNICTQIETVVNRQVAGEINMPVIAGDLRLRIKVPTLDILCTDTRQLENYRSVVDKEIRGQVEYVKRE